MVPMQNDQNNITSPYLDYDLIALSNTMAHSFEDGLKLASSMLNAPFLITNFYDYVVVHAEAIRTDDPNWNHVITKRVCPSKVIDNNKAFYTVNIPHIGKMVYYSSTSPSIRQQQLATYIAWMISQFGKERFQISDSNNTTKSTFLFYLLNNRLDLIDVDSNVLLASLPKNMQLLACYCNAQTDYNITEISKICNNTEYVSIYKRKYRFFLFQQLTHEQEQELSDYLDKHNMYAGLSYHFSNYNDCRMFVAQAIVALNESKKRGFAEHLTSYETAFILDVLYHYSSDNPLSIYRHPFFMALEDYDRNYNSEFYLTAITYITNLGDTRKTAKQLSMHRNTVLYRLGQILDITGYNIQDSTRRSSLLYAMAIEHVLGKQKKH